MKKNFLIISLIFLNFSLFAQTYFDAIELSTEEINFGDVYENAPDSIILSLNNISGTNITIDEIVFLDTYGEPAFSTLENNFTMNAEENKDIWIKFSPKHNIYHNSEILIVAHNDQHEYSSHNVNLYGQGKYNNSYYSSTENKAEEELKQELRSIISYPYNSLGYNGARDQMYMVIDNKKTNGQGASQNTIECVYTGRIAVGYTSRSNLYSGHDFNCEHTFPQGQFDSDEPMRSDIHHLFPTDVDANGIRSNYPFFTVANPSWEEGGSKQGSNMFEPRDIQKGATARAMLYFVTRYQNYNNFFTAQENLLKTWSNNFLPNEIEKDRNDAIENVQDNRNPFVDYPQFADRITLFASSPSVETENYSLIFSVDTIYIENALIVYNIVIANNGNQEIILSNITNNVDLLFLENGEEFNTINNKTIGVGEAISLDIFNPNILVKNYVDGFINFETNIPTKNNMSIPIKKTPSSDVHNFRNMSFKAPLIFPKPSNEDIFINFHEKNDKNYNIKIINTFGQVVKNIDLINNQLNNKINIADLKSGIYFLKIIGDNFLFSEKIIK